MSEENVEVAAALDAFEATDVERLLGFMDPEELSSSPTSRWWRS